MLEEVIFGKDSIVVYLEKFNDRFGITFQTDYDEFDTKTLYFSREEFLDIISKMTKFAESN
jgi:hypothetical protein